MEEKKKNSVGKIILIIILLILFLTGGFFGGKYYTENKKVDSKEEKAEEKEVKTKDLDINSRLVQFLYNMVTADTDVNCFTGWEYETSLGLQNRKHNYIHDNSKTTNIDLIITGENLGNMPKYNINVEDVPTISGRNKSSYSSGSASYYYTKKDVEKVYKLIFGKDAKLDTSKEIMMDLFGTEVLYYDSATDRYYPQYIAGGGTCGPSGISYKLSSAKKEGNKIKIYQDVEEVSYDADENGNFEISDKYKQVEKYKYVYTFKLEDDEMYKFVSRVKEK